MKQTQIDCLRRYITDYPNLSNNALAVVVVEKSNTFNNYSPGSVANYIGRVKKMPKDVVETQKGSVVAIEPKNYRLFVCLDPSFKTGRSKLAMVKMIKEEVGLGLKACKDFVDSLQDTATVHYAVMVRASQAEMFINQAKEYGYLAGTDMDSLVVNELDCTYVAFGGFGTAKDKQAVIDVIIEITEVDLVEFQDDLDQADLDNPVVFAVGDEEAAELYETLFQFGCQVGIAHIDNDSPETRKAQIEAQIDFRPTTAELWDHPGEVFDPRAGVEDNNRQELAVMPSIETPVIPKHTDVVIMAGLDIMDGVNIDNYKNAINPEGNLRMFVFGDGVREVPTEGGNLYIQYGGAGSRMVEEEGEEGDEEGTYMVAGRTLEDYRLYDAIDNVIAELLRSTEDGEDVNITIINNRGVDFGSRYSSNHIVELVNKCKNQLGWCINSMTMEGNALSNGLKIGVDSSNCAQFDTVERALITASDARRERNLQLQTKSPGMPVGYFNY